MFQPDGLHDGRHMKQLPQIVLREAFTYSDGAFFWNPRKGEGREIKRFNTVFAGSPVRPVVDRAGYLVLQLHGIRLKMHRAVFAYHHDEWPETVDHIDGDRSNNRVENLRPATKSEQQWNKSAKGYSTKGSRWVARIKVGGRRINLGSFQTERAAAEAYREAKVRLHNSYGL